MNTLKRGAVMLLRTVFTTPIVAVLVLVLARFAWLLIGADASVDMVDWVYRRSDFWVRPFFAFIQFEDRVPEAGGKLELASAAAFGAYLLAGTAAYGIVSRVIVRPR